MYKRHNTDCIKMDTKLSGKVRRKIRAKAGKKQIRKKDVLTWAKTLITKENLEANPYYWLRTVQHYENIEVVDKKWVVITDNLRSKSVEYC